MLDAVRAGVPEVRVAKYDFAVLPFLRQLEIVADTDILVGNHGAGLTHGFFLPARSILFELHQCGDHRNYVGIARLANHTYMTWNASDPHTISVPDNPWAASFTFDPIHFAVRIREAIDVVKRRRSGEDIMVIGPPMKV